MAELAMCRVCLAEDIGMRSIANTHLQKVYEVLTLMPLEMGRRPLHVCYICHAVLKNCYRLKERCLRAEEFLTQVLSSDVLQPNLLKDKKLYTQQLTIMHPGVNLSMNGVAQSDTDDEATESVEDGPPAPEALEQVVVGIESVKDTEDIQNEIEDEILVETINEDQSPGPSQPNDHSYTKVAKVKRTILNKTRKSSSILAKLLRTPQKKRNNTSIASRCTFVNQANARVVTKGVNKNIVVEKPEVASKTPASIDEPTKNSLHMQKSYLCDVCSEYFSTFTELSDHIYVHSNYKCNICKKGFGAASHLKVHMRVHNGGNAFQCQWCSKSFTDKLSFENHVRTHSDERPFSCDVCKKSYRRLDALKIHIRLHTGEKPYMCDVCKKCFPGKTHLTEHTRLHTGEKPFSCDVCEKCFSKKSYLIAHKQSHSSEKYMCNVCLKCFSGKQYLAVHSRLHTGERFSCDVCRKDFINKCSLVRHMRLHNGEKPFMCDVCGQSFKEKSHLKRHALVHTGEKPYSCNVCEKRFTQKNNLEGHARTHTGEKPYRCEICKEQFSYHRSLKSHVHKHMEQLNCKTNGISLLQIM